MKNDVTLRLSRGMYLAIRELAESLDVEISVMAEVLVLVGLSHVKGNRISPDTRALMLADALEGWATFIRAMTSLPKDQRAAAEKKWGEFLQRLSDAVQAGAKP